MRKFTAAVLALFVGLLAFAQASPARANANGKRPRILVTGFTPFGWRLTDANPTNISWDMALSLDGKIVKGYEVVAKQLPVVFEKVSDELPKLIAEVRPAAYLAFGQGYDGSILLEEIANRQYDSAAADTTGAQPKPVVVRADGPDVYRTTLPLDRIQKALRWAYPNGRSQDAGKFVCEYTFYLARHTFDRDGLAGPTGFIHFPPRDATDQDQAKRRFAALRIVAAVVDTLPPASCPSTTAASRPGP